MQNQILINFILTLSFSFLVGLEIKAYRLQYQKDMEKDFFGTTRTFTFIGVLGFIFYKIEPQHFTMFIVGFMGLTLLYVLFYMQKIKREKYSILLYLVMSLVYSIGVIFSLYPLWFGAFIFVFLVFTLNSKSILYKFGTSINTYEFETLGKMILLSAVVLPLLPRENVIPYIPISPFKIWLAVVVISAISYGGYLFEKYFFPNKGLYLTGIIGGIYSSTATTVVLSRKAKKIGKTNIIDAAIISATSVMFLRLIVVAFIFDLDIAKSIALPFIILLIIGFIISFFYLSRRKNDIPSVDFADRNPLELGTALLFALLFVIMIVLTHYITLKYGSGGLKIFSFVVGLSDIDPFILSLLTGKYAIDQKQITDAIFIAVGSNNFIKAFYSLYFGGIKNTYRSSIWIFLLGIASIALTF